MSPAATVHLVDDEESLLRALSRMLRAEGFDVRSFTSAAQLLAQLTPEARGCIVTDLSMPQMSGLELQEALAETGAALPIVFLTGRGDISSSVHAMRGGAVDFIEKCAPREDLLAAIRRALENEAAGYDARVRLMELRERCARLTSREREVLQHVVSGSMNKQIAFKLGINVRTVKLHRTSITTKLGVHSVAELTALTREARLFD